MMPCSKGIISIYFILIATSLSMASPLTPYTKTCPAYKKAMKQLTGTPKDADRLAVLSAKAGCPQKQTAILGAALYCYDHARYRCALALAGMITMERLLPTALLCQARSAFHMGKLQKSLERLALLIKKPVLRASGKALRLKILCRIGKCKQGIMDTLDNIEGMDNKNLFRIRMMLMQAFFETGQTQRALHLGEFLYFNSVGEREKTVLKALKLLNPLQARTARLLKQLFFTKNTAKSITGFIRRHYHSLKNTPDAWNAAMQMRSNDRPEKHWATSLAYALKEDKADNGKPLIQLVKHDEWFPMFPKALDRVCTGYCTSLTPGDIKAIIQKIPVETGYRPIARMKIGMCMLQKGMTAEAAQLLSIHNSVQPAFTGLVFGLKEETLALAALAAMRDHRIEEAIKAWKRLGLAWPYTYLAVMARTRLQAFGYKIKQQKSGKLVDDLSPVGMTGLELLRMDQPGQAIDLLTSIRNAGMMKSADTQVLARLLKRHWGLRAQLADFLRGSPYRRMRGLFRAAWPRAYERQVSRAGRQIGIPISLLFATARAESRFRAWAVSNRGAYGLMQVQKHTAMVVARRILKRPGMARSLFFPMNSLLIGGHYLKLLIDHFNGYLPLALVAYNAGLSSAHAIFNNSRGMPTELFIISLRPKIVRFYVEQILSMSPAYGFLYHTPVPGCLLRVPQTLKNFPIKLSVDP